MSPWSSLQVLDGPGELATEAAARFARAAARALERGSLFRVALSGGSTPLQTYRLLATAPASFPVRWGSVQFFWGDERFVPPDDPQSNYRAACEAFLDHLPRPPAGVFPVPTGAGSPAAAAAAYEATLRSAFAVQGVPQFDLILLGLGTDGHTASLFPGAIPDPRDAALVAGIQAEGLSPGRISLTPNTLNHAREVVFLVVGADKADILRRVLQSEAPDPDLPATLVQPMDGTITWMADRAAAADCGQSTGERS